MQKIIGRLACRNYGYECSFMTKEDLAEIVIEEFRSHTLEEHYIDYPEGILMKFIMNRK